MLKVTVIDKKQFIILLLILEVYVMIENIQQIYYYK